MALPSQPTLHGRGHPTQFTKRCSTTRKENLKCPRLVAFSFLSKSQRCSRKPSIWKRHWLVHVAVLFLCTSPSYSPQSPSLHPGNVESYTLLRTYTCTCDIIFINGSAQNLGGFEENHVVFSPSKFWHMFKSANFVEVLMTSHAYNYTLSSRCPQ